jgi:phospholipid/cholesterol/gamma-HCH transport system permease protein
LLAIFISNFFLSWLMFQGTGSAVLKGVWGGKPLK